MENTDYNENVNCYWEFISEDKKYQHLPTPVEYQYWYREREEKIKFKLGETCITTVHPHKMKYMTNYSWICYGSKLPLGCYSDNCHFPVSQS